MSVSTSLSWQRALGIALCVYVFTNFFGGFLFALFAFIMGDVYLKDALIMPILLACVSGLFSSPTIPVLWLGIWSIDHALEQWSLKSLALAILGIICFTGIVGLVFYSSQKWIFEKMLKEFDNLITFGYSAIVCTTVIPFLAKKHWKRYG